MNSVTDVAPDRNSLGKAAFMIGLIALVLSFIPIIGFVSWLLAPLAIIFGLIALRKPSRSLAIVGLVTGLIALVVCFSWIGATQSVGEAMSADTFNTTGEPRDMAEAPIVEANIQQLWQELEDNAIAAGQKYGGNRLHFTDESIQDFGGDVSRPSLSFVGNRDDFLEYYVSGSFSDADGAELGGLSKGQSVSFTCTEINESFGDGYNLSGCSLD